MTRKKSFPLVCDRKKKYITEYSKKKYGASNTKQLKMRKTSRTATKDEQKKKNNVSPAN